MVFTDGKTHSSDQKRLKPAQKAWAANDVTTYAIGIGSGIKKAELEVISGDAKRVMQPKNFNELTSTAEKLIAQVCKKLGRCFSIFLVACYATPHPALSVRPSVRRSVRPSVGPSVGRSVTPVQKPRFSAVFSHDEILH